MVMTALSTFSISRIVCSGAHIDASVFVPPTLAHSYMLARERSEQIRVSPVIATILKFTSEETRSVQRALQNSQQLQPALMSWLGPFS
jgi:hypothetical protein